MTLGGNIEGILPNMDCVKQNEHLSPSQNWYYQMDDVWLPWGRQWRFKVKVWIFNVPFTFTERWFCIRVHNNWSWDKDNFNPPFEYETPLVSVTENELPQALCCDDEKIESEKPVYTLETDCQCQEEENKEIITFLKWYYENVDNPDNTVEIAQFINDFKVTQFYQDLINKYNINKHIWTMADEKLAVLSEIENRERLMKNGRNVTDIDYQMLQLKDEVNQTLPMTFDAFLSYQFTIYLE